MRANHTDDHLAAVAAVKCARGNACCSTRHIMRGRRRGSSRRSNRHRVSKEQWFSDGRRRPPTPRTPACVGKRCRECLKVIRCPPYCGAGLVCRLAVCCGYGLF